MRLSITSSQLVATLGEPSIWNWGAESMVGGRGPGAGDGVTVCRQQDAVNVQTMTL